MKDFTKYYAAIDADKAFQTELVRVYGKKACDLRYQQAAHDDAVLQLTLEIKLQADAAWRQEMQS